MKNLKLILISIIIIISLLFISISINWFYEINTNSNPKIDFNIELEDGNETKNFTFRIVNTYPHDPEAFTQGLVFENGFLYEGTGLNGRSSIRKVELETGWVIKNFKLSNDYFGEGVTIFDGKLIQLTWTSKIGFVYDLDTFELNRTFNYTGQGWGLTHDGTHLIMSDGTSEIRYLDPSTFTELHRIQVLEKNTPIFDINELEFVNGEILGNIWQTNKIVRIDPETGEVLGWIYLNGLFNHQDYTMPIDVLNGIAYDSENDRLFVTGKLWPNIFEIELKEIEN